MLKNRTTRCISVFEWWPWNPSFKSVSRIPSFFKSGFQIRPSIPSSEEDCIILFRNLFLQLHIRLRKSGPEIWTLALKNAINYEIWPLNMGIKCEIWPWKPSTATFADINLPKWPSNPPLSPLLGFTPNGTLKTISNKIS